MWLHANTSTRLRTKPPSPFAHWILFGGTLPISIPISSLRSFHRPTSFSHPSCTTRWASLISTPGRTSHGDSLTSTLKARNTAPKMAGWCAPSQRCCMLMGIRTQAFPMSMKHCGRMDDPDYVMGSFVPRLSLYLQAGYTIGVDLIFTFETKQTPLTPQAVTDLLAQYF